ncbi:uncharacterized protein VICG_00213, partial [Vittaforma corneae ATCC 50505]
MSNSKITSIIAHIDHGKTTLLDSIIASTGYFSKSLVGSLRYLDSRADEQEREITMKLSPIKLSNGHVFIDTPGHVDFENLLFSSSILSDNHIILVDVNEGITPRTYSLVKFINRDRCVLVINKIDKCSDFETVDLVLMQINGMLGEEVFGWQRNNIVISSATLGAGMSHGTFRFSPKNTLQQAFKTFKTLNAKIDKNDVDQIIKKYGIKFANKKIIFSTVMPLYEAIFNTVDHIYERIDLSVLKPLKIDESSKLNTTDVNEPDWFRIDNELFSVSFENRPSFYGITTYGVLRNRNEFKRENVIQLMKILGGKVTKGDRLYSCSDNEQRYVVLDEIYDFSIDGYTKVISFEGPGLVYVGGDFLKNSIISTEPAVFSLKRVPTPFFCSRLILKDLAKIDDLKSVIRAISFTEQNLKVKLNKFSEFEFKCSGNVQFEKICYDLKECGFDFMTKESKKEFREFATKIAKIKCADASIGLEVIIGPISLFDKSLKAELGIKDQDPRIKFSEPKNNIYCIDGENDNHIIESVLDIFTDSGPVIKERIINTFFYIKSSKDMNIMFFNTLKNALSDLYLQTDPSICPLCLSILFSV